MPKYQHILVATDLSPESRFVMEHAKEAASALGAKLSIVHVIEPLPVYAYTYIDSVGLEKQQIDEAQETLANLGEEFGVENDNQVLKIGHAKTEIVALADELKVDIIVVGSHIHHRFASLLGSTANAITHTAHCDVLVVRHEAAQ